VDKAGETLWLIVVDGRQQNYSEGVTLAELAGIAVELGADRALNLDGGGSSTLVMARDRGAKVLNAPIHTRVPMRERPVANHLGVYAQPVDE
jgi:exopolysaccharide biosynthesis protein